MSELVLSPFSQRGEEIYREQILPEISEPQCKGKFIAIEVDSGKYFIDDADIQAIIRAQREFPNKQFYLKRIGYRAAHSHHGIVRKARS